jgi:hypothetical protein
MNGEIKHNLLNYEAIKQKVFTAFADVTLGEGIGFWEADAIDDHLLPTSEEYLIAKVQDERLDFRKVFDFVAKFESYPSQIHCFMDAKGLHFHLPVILLLGDNHTKDSVLQYWFFKEKPEYIELMNLLTLEQKKCIIECIEYDFECAIQLYENHKGYKCSKCNEIHNPVNYTYEQAKQLAQSGDEYILLQKLKKHFNL